MKKILLILTLFSSLCSPAQYTPGSLAPDFNVQDIEGNTRSLYSQLDSGKTVILHCFAAWDSYAWEYYQQQTLETFASLYGSNGSGNAEVWRVECETQNSLSQLQGPALSSGNVAFDTQGDWLTQSTLPVIDDSTLSVQLALPYLPLLLVICPDRIVRFADQLSLGNLTNLVFQTSCPPVAEGFDPALISAITSRECGSNFIDIQLVIKNLGTDTISNASIVLSGAINNQSILWEGQLASYGSDTIQITGLEVLSDTDIRIAIEDDNVNSSNDSLSVGSDVGFSTQLVKLELALDAYPEEISWEIRNESDSVIYSGGGYEVDYQYISNVFQLPASGCYQLFINDTQGDGLHGSQYGGFDGFCKLYSMTDSTTIEEEMFFYDGSFGFTTIANTPAFLQYSFDAGSPLWVDEIPLPKWVLYPNPADNMLNINITSGNGPIEISMLNAAGELVFRQQIKEYTTAIRVDVSSLPCGMYMFTLKSTDNYLGTRLIINQ